MESLWREQTPKLSSKADSNHLTMENVHRDVIVVGAGMAGILIAYYLKEKRKNVLVLEADEIASEQTERTTAKITSQHGVKYSTLIETIGAKKARLYAQANEKAVKEYERLIRSKGIECQFQWVPAYLYSMQNKKVLWKEAEAARSLGIDAFFTKETELPFEVTGAVCFQKQASFAPLEFLKEISKDLEIWERVKVMKIRKNRVITNDMVLTADKIVVATHYPFRNVPGFYFLRQHQERSYVLALSGGAKIEGMYIGIDKNGLSFRQAGDFLLFGGGSHRTGKNRNGGKYDYLWEMAKLYYPDSQEVSHWSAQDCMPHDGIPFIGK